MLADCPGSAEESHVSWLSASFTWGNKKKQTKKTHTKKAQSIQPRFTVCERVGKRSHPLTALSITHSCKEGHRLCKHLREKDELTNEVTHFNTFTGNVNFTRAQQWRHLQRGSAKNSDFSSLLQGLIYISDFILLAVLAVARYCSPSASQELPKPTRDRRAADTDALFLPSICPPLTARTIHPRRCALAGRRCQHSPPAPGPQDRRVRLKLTKDTASTSGA